MRIYLDDHLTSGLLTRLLRNAGHDLRLPAEIGRAGSHDAVHLRHAIQERRVFLSEDHEDFKVLHELVLEAQGHHPGILIVRRDNDRRRDLTPQGIVRAIRNLEAANVPLPDQFHILNHWR